MKVATVGQAKAPRGKRAERARAPASSSSAAHRRPSEGRREEEEGTEVGGLGDAGRGAEGAGLGDDEVVAEVRLHHGLQQRLLVHPDHLNALRSAPLPIPSSSLPHLLPDGGDQLLERRLPQAGLPLEEEEAGGGGLQPDEEPQLRRLLRTLSALSGQRLLPRGRDSRTHLGDEESQCWRRKCPRRASDELRPAARAPPTAFPAWENLHWMVKWRR